MGLKADELPREGIPASMRRFLKEVIHNEFGSSRQHPMGGPL
jgi:hypothetical protein